MITNLFVKDRQILLVCAFKLVFKLYHTADMKDQLLFDSVCIFTHFERRRHQLILSELHSQASAELDCVRNVLDCTGLCHPLPENYSYKLIVVREHLVDGVVLMIIVFVNVLDYFDFRLRISHIQLIH